MKNYILIQTNNNGNGDIFTEKIKADTFDEAVENGIYVAKKLSAYDRKHMLIEVAEYDVDKAIKELIEDGYADDKGEAIKQLDNDAWVADAITRCKKI